MSSRHGGLLLRTSHRTGLVGPHPAPQVDIVRTAEAVLGPVRKAEGPSISLAANVQRERPCGRRGVGGDGINGGTVSLGDQGSLVAHVGYERPCCGRNWYSCRAGNTPPSPLSSGSGARRGCPSGGSASDVMGRLSACVTRAFEPLKYRASSARD